MQHNATLIIGANSEIAKALATTIRLNTDDYIVIVSRDISYYQNNSSHRQLCIKVDNYNEQSIKRCIENIKQQPKLIFNQVFICHGLLHNKTCQPEKRLEDFTSEAFLEVATVNTITPMLWLKHLTPYLAGKTPTKIVLFTARVASISDNNLGGWYSYRSSKAALNMLIKSAAIELSRRAKNLKLISFHPGTTDSPLSKPFQKNVPSGKLFSSEFVAQQLLAILKSTPVDGQASYLDWQGKTIDW